MKPWHFIGMVLWFFVPALSSADVTSPTIFQRVGFAQHLGQQIPLQLPFTNELDQKVQLGDYFARQPVILALTYYQCPNLCSVVTTALVDSLRLVHFVAGKQYQVVIVSIDPHDTPALAAARKAGYLAHLGAQAARGWHFLTGATTSITPLAAAIGFRYFYDPKLQQYAHPAGIVVATPDGKITRYFFGVRYPSYDLRLSLLQAARGHIGSVIDQLVMLCYHYDPISGKYGIVVVNLLRLAAVVTLLMLGGFMGVALYREKQKRA